MFYENCMHVIRIQPNSQRDFKIFGENKANVSIDN